MTTDDFRIATAVVPDEHVPGRFHGDIPDGWGTQAGVQGGVLIAMIARAMCAAHGRDHGMELRTVHASFLERPTSGNLVVDTEVVRVGGMTAHVEASARSHGQDETAARVWALFGRSRAGVGTPHLDARRPDVPSHDEVEIESPTAVGAPTTPPLFERLDLRGVIGDLPWTPNWTADQPARFARWNRYVVDPVVDEGGDDDGQLELLSLLPIADLPATALWVRSAPGDPFLACISLELTVNFLERPTTPWILADFRARWFDDGYLFTEGDLWSEDRLVAVASQIMMVREVVP